MYEFGAVRGCISLARSSMMWSFDSSNPFWMKRDQGGSWQSRCKNHISEYTSKLFFQNGKYCSCHSSTLWTRWFDLFEESYVSLITIQHIKSERQSTSIRKSGLYGKGWKVQSLLVWLLWRECKQDFEQIRLNAVKLCTRICSYLNLAVAVHRCIPCECTSDNVRLAKWHTQIRRSGLNVNESSVHWKSIPFD